MPDDYRKVSLRRGCPINVLCGTDAVLNNAVVATVVSDIVIGLCPDEPDLRRSKDGRGESRRRRRSSICQRACVYSIAVYESLPELSVEPFQFRVMVVSVRPVTTRLVGAVGPLRPPGDAEVIGPMKSSAAKKVSTPTPTTIREVCLDMICSPPLVESFG